MKNLFKINKCKYLKETTCLSSNEEKHACSQKDGHLNYQ